MEQLIPPEIKNDPFYTAIYKLSQSAAIKTVLEIGSSSGEGSTEAFVKGINENPYHPTLFCMEVSKPRFKALKERYANYEWVVCYNVSSVPLESFPKEDEILSFMKTVDTTLRGFQPEEVIRWLKQDIDYVAGSDIPQNGIELIKSEQGIEYFDMVLIDGSEFTGKAELELIYDKIYSFCTYIRAFKNYHNYMRLLHDSNYKLVEEQLVLRNGYAIFKKISTH